MVSIFSILDGRERCFGILGVFCNGSNLDFESQAGPIKRKEQNPLRCWKKRKQTLAFIAMSEASIISGNSENAMRSYN